MFLSLSLPDDPARAPAGHRALTISTHTDLRPWWELFERDRPAYEARKAEYAERVLAAAEVALPGLRAAARLILPGTPVTFQRYTEPLARLGRRLPADLAVPGLGAAAGAWSVAGRRQHLSRAVDPRHRAGRHRACRRPL